MKLITSYVMGAFFGAGLFFIVVHNPLNIALLKNVQNSSLAVIKKDPQAEILGESYTKKIEETSPTPKPKLSEVDVFIEEKLKNMSLKEKLGQMFMWQISGKELTEKDKKMIQDTNVGGIIVMGEHTPEQLNLLTQQIQQLQKNLPAFIAIDQEGGDVKRLTQDTNPGAPTLGQGSEEDLCKAVEETSKLLWANGVNLNFGIVADIAWYENSFISNRTFGKTPYIVAKKVSKAVSCTRSVFSTVKHFPGHGRTELDSHKIIPEIDISYEEWETTDALPFKKAIEEDVDFIMLGHLNYKNIATQPASLSQEYVGQLRNMGFQKVIITDDMGMLESSGENPYTSLEKALNAGVDMLLYVRTKEEPADIYEHALKYVVENKSLQDSLEERLKRITSMKYYLVNSKFYEDK